jgi:hypothetical protein
MGNFIKKSALLFFIVLFLVPMLARQGYCEIKPKVFFIAPKNNAQLHSPIKLEFGVEGMLVAPAGELKEGSGHHHIIIDGGYIEKGTPIPADDKHIHYGKGQTSAELTLPPGKYSLTMQFADGIHRSYGEELSETITITVLE